MKNLYNFLTVLCLFALPIISSAQVTVNTSGMLTVPKSGEAIRLSGSSSYVTFFNGGTYNGYLWHSNTNMYMMNRHATGNLYLGAGNSTKVTIEPNGEVGIGTTSPLADLHINASGGGNMLRMSSTSGNGYAGFYSGTTLEGWIENYNDDLNVTSATGDLRLRAYSSGSDVRIEPAGKVDVQAAEVRLTDASSKFINFYNGTTRIGYISALSNNNMQIDPTNGGGIYLNSDDVVNVNTPGGTSKFNSDGTVTMQGNLVVGSGTSSAANFKSQGTSELEMALDATTGNADFSMQLAGITKTQIRYSAGLQGLEFLADQSNATSTGLTPGARALFIDGVNQRVHIGGANPQAALDVEGSIHYSGSISNTSDARLKTDVKDFKYGLKELKELNPIMYHYNGKASTPTDKEYVGIFAQDLQKVAPELVGTFEHVTYKNQSEKQVGEEAPIEIAKTEKYLNIQESAIKYMLINSVKELADKNEALDAQNAELETKNAELEARLDKIEALLAGNNADAKIETANETDVVLAGNGDVAELTQNQPNPFTEKTTIHYFLPEGTTGAHMNIYSSTGKVLKTIRIDEPGNGQINVQANSLPAGNYMYQLVTDTGIIGSKSMVLVK